MRYFKKYKEIEARQVTKTNGELVLTAHGRVRAEAGDWILTDPDNGDTWPVKHDFFSENYEPANPDSFKDNYELLKKNDNILSPQQISNNIRNDVTGLNRKSQ